MFPNLTGPIHATMFPNVTLRLGSKKKVLTHSELFSSIFLYTLRIFVGYSHFGGKGPFLAIFSTCFGAYLSTGFGTFILGVYSKLIPVHN